MIQNYFKRTYNVKINSLKERKYRCRCIKDLINNNHRKVVIQCHLFSFSKEFYLFSELFSERTKPGSKEDQKKTRRKGK